MPAVKASVSYKKQDGTLEYDVGRKSILWIPSAGGTSVTLNISTVNNLKQTPASSDKVALKVEAEAGTFTFAFTGHGNARAEQERVTETLRNAITAARSVAPTPHVGPPASNNMGDGSSAAMAIASAVRSESNPSNSWLDDKRLMANVDLQKSLFEKDTGLRQRFEQAVKEKPDEITFAQFGRQFWSARLNLLRALAMEKSQQQGAYNVLAEVKETIEPDGKRKLNITREQIQALFNQHAIIRQIYNVVVPKPLDEASFWTRFFRSRLLLKLKGQRITDANPTDVIFDKYLTSDAASLRSNETAESHIPHFIDLEGNEQNHSQRQGNRPHYSMIPEFSGKAPILRVLNSMSERMMVNVQPNDGQRHGPIGIDEETYNELRLRDLQAIESDNRVMLNIRNQRSLFGSIEDQQSETVRRYGKRDPRKVLASVRQSMGTGVVLGPEETSGQDRDGEDDQQALSQLLSLLKEQRDLSSEATSTSTLSEAALQSAILAQNTTIEFLHYFWTMLTSVANGSSTSTKKELAALHSTLDKSVHRIEAVADGAEKERYARITALKRQAQEYTAKTGKRRKVDESVVTIGGQKEVYEIMAPTLKAIAVAGEKYRAAVNE